MKNAKAETTTKLCMILTAKYLPITTCTDCNIVTVVGGGALAELAKTILGFTYALIAKKLEIIFD
jgi:hypothetical protein